LTYIVAIYSVCGVVQRKNFGGPSQSGVVRVPCSRI